MHPKDTSSASAEAILCDVLDVVSALRHGHFSTHMPEKLPGIGGQIASELNALLDMLQSLRHEHHRLTEEIGVTGRLGGQMEVAGTCGAWKEMMDGLNRMGANLTCQYRDGWNTARALTSGDPSARMTCQLIGGEFREFRERFNQIADQLEEKAAQPATL